MSKTIAQQSYRGTMPIPVFVENDDLQAVPVSRSAQPIPLDESGFLLSNDDPYGASNSTPGASSNIGPGQVVTPPNRNLDGQPDYTTPEPPALPPRGPGFFSKLPWKPIALAALFLLIGGGFVTTAILTSRSKKPESTTSQASLQTDLSNKTLTVNLHLKVTQLTELQDLIVHGTTNLEKGLAVTGNGNFSGTVTAAKFVGDGSGLTNLPGSNSTSSPTNAVVLNPGSPQQGNISITGSLAAGGLQGNGAQITSINADNITTGNLSDSRLSSNVALLNANNIFSGSNTFQSGISGTSASFSGNVSALSFTQNGNTVCDSSNNCGFGGGGGTSFVQGGNSFGATATMGTNDNFALNIRTNGVTRLTLDTSGNGNLTGTLTAGAFSGNGAALTSLNASNVASGSLADARLSSNVPLKNAANIFSALNNFTGGLQQNSNTVCDTSGNCAAAGAAGGDLTGTYPNPTIAKLKGTTVTISSLTGGNFLQYNGSAWVNQSLSGDVVVDNGGVATIQPNSVALGTDTTGNYVANLGTLTGLTTTGNSGEGSTPTLSVTYGSGANTAVQGNVTLTCPSGSGNLTGGGTSITLGTGGSCASISTVNNPTFSTSVTTPQLILTGAGSNGTLQVATLGQSTTYTLPDPGGASATICLTSGNCAGTGSGVTTAGGTTGALAKFTGSQAIGNSTLSESGSIVTASGTFVIQGSNALTLGTATGNNGAILFKNSTNSNTLTLQSGASGSSFSLTLPTTGGNNGDCLESTGGGVLVFTACTGGAGGGVTSLDGLTGVLTLANSSGSGSTITINNAAADGSTKGIATFNSTNFSASSGVVNTIQNIATSSTPSFAAATLTNASSLTLGTASTNTGSVLFKGSGSANTVTLQGPTSPSTNTLTLPNETGTLCSTGSICSGYQASIANYVANLGTLTGLTTSGNSGAGSTPTLSVTYGSGANTAVQGNTTLSCPSASGNTSLSGGGNTITLGSGGTCNALSLSNTPSFTSETLGIASTTNGALTLLNSTNSFGVTLQATAQTSGSATISLPNTSGTNDTICLLTLSNCVGGAGGGAPNNAAYLTIGNNATLSNERAIAVGANLQVTDGGANGNYTIDTIQGIQTSSSPQFTGATLTGASALTLGTASTNTGAILFKGLGSANTLTLQGPTSPSTNTLTLPNETGTICSTGSVCTGYQSALTFNNGLTNSSGTVQLGGSLIQATTIATGNSQTLTLTSDLSGGARSNYALIVSQAQNASNDNNTGLVQFSNADTASTGAVLTVDNQNTSGTGLSFTSLTGGTNILLSTTTGTGIDANTVSGGGKVIAASLGNGATSTSVISVVNNASGITADYTGGLINISPTRTLAAAATRNESGNFLRLNRSNVVTNASGTYNITGAVATLSSNCTQTAGTCTDSSNILSLNQQYANASGSVFNVAGSGTGNLATLDTTNASANGVSIDVQSNSSSNYALNVTRNNGSPGLYVEADGLVGIGTNTPGAKLDVVGGNIQGNQNLTLTGTYTTANSNRLRITGTLNSSVTTNQYGIQNDVNFTPTGGSLSTIYGNSSNPVIAGSSLTIGTVTGFSGRVDTAAGFTGTITSGYGAWLQAPVLNGGKITNSAGVQVDMPGSGASDNSGNTTGTVNNYGIRVSSATSAAGSGGTLNNYGAQITVPNGDGTAGTTNNYGLRVTGNSSAGDTNYALYVDSTTQNYFAGNVGIGDTSPAALLTVGNGDLFQVNSSGQVSYVDGTTNTSTYVCKNASGQLAACSGTSTGSAFVQGGNSFGALATLGTTDANALQFITNSTARGTFANGNTLYLGNADATGVAASPNAFTVQGTSASGAATAGAAVTLQAGTGNTSGNGGALNLTGGTAGSTGTGGAVGITGGTASGSGNVGGAVNINGGSGGSGLGIGGNVVITAGGAGSGAFSGQVQIKTPAVGTIGGATIALSTVSNNAGASNISVTAGNGGSSANAVAGGNITITAGAGDTGVGNGGTGGNVTINAGAAGASSTAGTISVGTSNTSSLTVGNTTASTTTLLQGGTGSSAVSIQAGSSGTINIATTAQANTVQIGATTGAVAQTINIGNNNTASSTDTIVMGNLLGSSSTTVQGGTLVSIQSAASGTVNIGTAQVSNNVTIGNNSSTTISIQSGASINVGTGQNPNIQIGSTTSATAQTIGIGNNATASSTDTITIGNLLSTSTTTIQGGTGSSAVTIKAGSGGTINIGTGGVANTIQIGTTTGAVAQTLNIGNNSTASSTSNVTVGSTVGSSNTTINGGTSGSIAIGAAGTTSSISLGNLAGALSTVSIGSAFSTSTTTIFGGTGSTAIQIQSGASGTISIGNNAVANTIQLGTTTGAVAQTIAIGNNATASSTTNVTIGNLLSTSATTIQGGTGASAIGIQAGASGVISIGTANAGNIFIGTAAGNQAITIGATTVGVGNTQTLNIGAAVISGSSTINLGSNLNSSTTNITGGSGGINIGTGSTTTPVQIGNIANAISQTINIGNNATASSTNTVTIGSTVGSSTTTVQSGTGNLNLKATDVLQVVSGNGPAYLGAADVSGSTNSGTGNSNVTATAVAGRYMYVSSTGNATACSQSAGSAIGCELQVYDVTRPGNPTYIGGADASGSTNSGTGNVTFQDIVVSGRYAYVTTAGNATACSQSAGSAIGCELQVYDISNPSAPTYVGGADVSGSTNSGTGNNFILSITISGRYAITSSFSNATACSQSAGSAIGCELKVFDISNPAAPAYIGGADISGTTNGGTTSESMAWVVASGRYVYAVKQFNSTACSQSAGSAVGCELQVYDLSNPAAPAYIGGADASGSTNSGTGSLTINSVATSGRYVYLASNSDATACSQSAGSAVGCELKVFDVSNPATPTYVGGADASGSTNSGTGAIGFNSVAVSGRYVYATTNNNATACSQSAGSAVGCELKIFDVSNPATPTYSAGIDENGSATGTGAVNINNVAINGHYVYTTQGGNATACSATAGSGDGCEIKAFDISGFEAVSVTANSLEAGTLQVASNASISNQLSVSGSLTIGQSSQLQGDISASGYALFKNATNSATSFQIQNADASTTIFDADTTNGRVGIGTNSPQARLDVTGSVAQGSVGTETELQLTRLVQGSVSWPQVASLAVGRYANPNPGVDVNPYTRLDFNLKNNANGTLSADTTVMTLQSNGNVGIGITAPTTPLHIVKNQNAPTVIELDNGNTGNLAYGYMQVTSDSANIIVGVGPGTANIASLSDSAFVIADSNASGGLQLGTRAGPLRFSTNGDANERLRISTTGNVGINNTNPTQGNLAITQITNGDSALYIKRATDSSPTGNFLQLQTNAGADLASIDISGNLTVKAATFNGNITVNGHVITANTSGSTTVAIGAAGSCTVTTGSSATISGNDTSGTVTITTGTTCLAGTFATVTFANAFGTAPRVILSPANGNGSTVQYYNNGSTTTTFTIDTNSNPANATTYKYNYWVVQ